MRDGDLRTVAELLKERNALDTKLGAIMGRPMTSGHLGEWIAAEVFDIELEPSASAKGIDGRFRSGELAGRTVNIKWYLKRDNVLDIAAADGPDYYLVLIGPPSTAASSVGGKRPWVIDAVHLFDAHQLLGDLRERGVRIGIATSVRGHHWDVARVYPTSETAALRIDPHQAELLRLFSSAALAPETQK